MAVLTVMVVLGEFHIPTVQTGTTAIAHDLADCPARLAIGRQEVAGLTAVDADDGGWRADHASVPATHADRGVTARSGVLGRRASRGSATLPVR